MALLACPLSICMLALIQSPNCLPMSACMYAHIVQAMTQQLHLEASGAMGFFCDAILIH